MVHGRASSAPMKATRCSGKRATAGRGSGEAIRERLERALAEGDLPEHRRPQGAMARYVVTVMRGMAVEAASGAKGSELHQIVDTAMRAWPVSKRRPQRR